LLRLLLPLNGKVWASSQKEEGEHSITASPPLFSPIRRSHRTIQSVGATGGVYKRHWWIQREVMTHTY